MSGKAGNSIIPLTGAIELGATEALGGFTYMLGSAFRTKLVPHVHPTYVMGVVDDGEVTVTVKGVSRRATPGCVIALAPWVPHTEVAGEEGWSFRYLYFTEAAVARAFANDVGRISRLGWMPSVIEDEGLALGIAQAHLWMTLRASVIEIERVLVSLLWRIAAEHCVPPVAKRTEGATRERVLKARQTILDGPFERIRVPELARAAGLSEFHFHRLFSELVGLSAYAFYDRVRIARAHEMLIRGVAPARVAHLLDYADQPHFTRHFSRASAFTPARLAAMSAGARAVVGGR